MKTEHTSGKWTYYKNSCYYDIKTDKNNRDLSVDLLLFDDNGKGLHHTKENEANAKLIAEATKTKKQRDELLEALIKAQIKVELLIGHLPTGEMRNIVTEENIEMLELIQNAT